MEGKVYAVTGGASGIGLAVAKQLRAQGAKLSIIDVNPDALESATKDLGGPSDDLMVSLVDVRNAGLVDAWIEATVSKFGKLDGAANIAGVIGKHHGLRELKDQDDEQWKLIFDVNVTGLMHCLRAELRHMKNGSIVNAASIQGVMGFAKHAAYSASKHAVVGLTRCAAKEVAPEISVNTIAPGVIETPLLTQALKTLGTEKDGHPLSDAAITRNGKAEEVANVVVFLLSDNASFVTGSIYSCDGGWDC